MTRHIIENSFSLHIEDKFGRTIDSKGWKKQTPFGLMNYMSKQPDWETMTLKRTKTVRDTQKKGDDNIVSQKETILRLARLGSGEVQAAKVEGNLTKDGQLLPNILTFWGNSEIHHNAR